MPLSNPALWARLQNWLGPQSASHPLVTQTANRFGVSHARARSIVEGYAQFIYLVATSDEMLAPPALIDEVWHIHLADHDAYLGAFSKVVVGRKVRHTKGRPIAGKDPAYARTRQRFVDEFDSQPFAKLWPKPDAEISKLPMLWLGVSGVLMVVGWLSPFDQFIGLGLTMGAVTLVYLWATAPWTLAPRGTDSGGCGGVVHNDSHRHNQSDQSSHDGGGDGDGCGGD